MFFDVWSTMAPLWFANESKMIFKEVVVNEPSGLRDNPMIGIMDVREEDVDDEEDEEDDLDDEEEDDVDEEDPIVVRNGHWENES